jgi:hypothetical protein
VVGFNSSHLEHTTPFGTLKHFFYFFMTSASCVSKNSGAREGFLSFFFFFAGASAIYIDLLPFSRAWFFLLFRMLMYEFLILVDLFHVFFISWDFLGTESVVIEEGGVMIEVFLSKAERGHVLSGDECNVRNV